MIIVLSFLLGVLGLIMGGGGGIIVGICTSGPIGILYGPFISLFGFWFLRIIWAIIFIELAQLYNYKISRLWFALQGLMIGAGAFSWIGIMNFVNMNNNNAKESIGFAIAFVIGGPICGLIINVLLFQIKKSANQSLKGRM